MAEKALLVIGPEPPPATGMELATQALLSELSRAAVPYFRVDTADPTDQLGNRGRWTFHNTRLGLGHLLTVGRKSFRSDIGAVYIPIAQEFPAFGRDLAFIFIARLARKPVAIHLHGGFFGMFYNSQGRLTRRLVRSIVGSVAVGIVLTEELRPALECVLPADRVVVVQNGLDLPQDHEGRLESPRNNQVRALFLSSLFPSKGVFVFIEAIAEARAASPELQGIIAGPWPTEEIRSEALALVRRLSMDQAVTFVGPVEGIAKARLFREVDIFCFPSSYRLEGQPLVIIEAMAAGLPVVATEWRGIPETVVDGETGILVDIASPKLVAEKLTLLARDAELRNRLGAAGRARYERLYTQGAFGNRMLRVLRPLLTAEGRNYSSRAEEVPE